MQVFCGGRAVPSLTCIKCDCVVLSQLRLSAAGVAWREVGAPMQPELTWVSTAGTGVLNTAPVE